ncbi:BnaC03g74780D [Brassica napus]|uniref:BnaC03g74780D protein n=1 Tax=Brassica napus TaxID=3708 RepID=A0A078JBE3_BRANA|nr:BnaC03g74780D [Brassica napus]
MIFLLSREVTTILIMIFQEAVQNAVPVVSAPTSEFPWATDDRPTGEKAWTD